MDEATQKEASVTSAGAEYRYEKFTTRLLFRDLRFRRETAKAGDQLPNTDLFTTTGERTSVSDLAAGKPVLLVFASLSCPMTASAMPLLRSLYGEFSQRIEFVVVNVREAHPGEHLPQPLTLQKKLEHAKALADLYDVPWTVVSDDIDGHLHRSLDPKPNSAFLIDAKGLIVFRSLWASDFTALRQALDYVASGKTPSKSESTTLFSPVFKAMGRVQEVMDRAGPQASNDLWRAAFPMAVAGRIAPLFTNLSHDRRGVAAVLALCLIVIVMSIGIMFARFWE